MCDWVPAGAFAAMVQSGVRAASLQTHVDGDRALVPGGRAVDRLCHLREPGASNSAVALTTVLNVAGWDKISFWASEAPPS